jgi:hypothetical protein
VNVQGNAAGGGALSQAFDWLCARGGDGSCDGGAEEYGEDGDGLHLDEKVNLNGLVKSDAVLRFAFASAGAQLSRR